MSLKNRVGSIGFIAMLVNLAFAALGQFGVLPPSTLRWVIQGMVLLAIIAFLVWKRLDRLGDGKRAWRPIVTDWNRWSREHG